MSLNAPLETPIYSGTGTSTLVPGLFDMSVNGRTYMWDMKYVAEGQFARDSIALLKDQQDTGTFGEQSLNPAEFPRRAHDSWHKGAGQTHVDRPESDPLRFRSSKGMNVWEKWKLSLLPDVSQQTSSAQTNLAVLTAGSYLYEVDGQQVYHRSAIDGARTSSVIHVAEGATTVQSITTDGYYVYAALGTNGVHRTVRGAATSSHYSDLQAELLGYAKGRLMAAIDNVLYNITASGAAPAALFTHPNTDWTWVGFADGRNVIYSAGYSGDKSFIYKTSVKADGTALDIPTVAGTLPDGEIVRAIHGYLTFLLIGTDKGVRFAVQDDNGDLTIGALIETGAVRCFEGQDRFVWFGWDNYDATSTGLGRLDLTVLNGSAPSYASDLMATGQGSVLSVCTFAEKRVFAVSGLGIYAEDTDLVASGTLDTGFITFGIPDTKVAQTVDIRTEPLAGSVAVSISADGGTFTSLGTHGTAGSTSSVIPAAQTVGETIELRWASSRSSTDTTTGPVITRTTLEANPAPGRGQFVTYPILLHHKVTTANGSTHTYNPRTEREALDAMEAAGRPVTVQTGEGAETVTLEDHRWIAKGYTPDRTAIEGTFLARFKRPRSRSNS